MVEMNNDIQFPKMAKVLLRKMTLIIFTTMTHVALFITSFKELSSLYVLV